MSRNKDIQYMHEMTGLPYSVCRKKLKENHWDLFEAMGYGDALALLSKTLESLTPTIQDALDTISVAVTNLAKSATEVCTNLLDSIGKMDRQELYDAIMKEVDNNEG